MQEDERKKAGMQHKSGQGEDLQVHRNAQEKWAAEREVSVCVR